MEAGSATAVSMAGAGLGQLIGITTAITTAAVEGGTRGERAMGGMEDMIKEAINQTIGMGAIKATVEEGGRMTMGVGREVSSSRLQLAAGEGSVLEGR